MAYNKLGTNNSRKLLRRRGWFMTKKPGFFVYGVDPVLLALSAENAKGEQEKQTKIVRSEKATNRKTLNKTLKGVSRINQGAK
jgi:hypothetical protein